MSLIKVIKNILDFLSGKKSVSTNTINLVSRDWREIEALVKGASPSQLRQALITADRSMDTVLKDLVPGETMGDRLKAAKNLFHPNTYDKIWQAHKLRNALVHESGFEAQHFVLKASIDNFKSGLKELGVNI